MNNQDKLFMRQAIELAAIPTIPPHPNPRVGCVLVKNNKIIGKGYHHAAGENHAEINALNNSTESPKDSTCYVTLEPCHHHGKTPPCTLALVEAGIKRVVIAQQDFNPRVSGQGIEFLQNNGIKVEQGLLSEEAAKLNIGFNHRMQFNRPYITVKMAMSLDGKTALNNGKSKWITGEQARADVHKHRLRAASILTGIGTVLADDPLLTARPADNITEIRQPTRVILDPNLEISQTAKLLQQPGSTLIYTNKKSLNYKNTEIINLACDHQKPKYLDLHAVISDLAKREINDVWIEAGSKLSGAFIAQNLVNEIIIYIAPKLLGHDANSLFKLPIITKLNNAVELKFEEIIPIGDDLKVIIKPK